MIQECSSVQQSATLFLALLMETTFCNYYIRFLNHISVPNVTSLDLLLSGRFDNSGSLFIKDILRCYFEINLLQGCESNYCLMENFPWNMS